MLSVSSVRSEDRERERDTHYILVQQLTAEDLREVEEALETLGVEKNRLIIEEQELSELKSELADYQEDVEDFKKVRCRLRMTLLCRCS